MSANTQKKCRDDFYTREVQQNNQMDCGIARRFCRRVSEAKQRIVNHARKFLAPSANQLTSS
jgi:hypothetical protein